MQENKKQPYKKSRQGLIERVRKIQRKKSFYITAVLILLVTCTFAAWNILSPSHQNTSNRKMIKAKASSKPVKIMGIVLEAMPESIQVKDSKGQIYRLIPPTGIKIFPIPAGTKIRADVSVFDVQNKSFVEGVFINLMVDS